MYKILFAVDGSEASLRAARGLAAVLRWAKPTDVEILNVQSETTILREAVVPSLRERAERRAREEGERALAMADAVLREVAARTAATVRLGDAATAIARAAEMLDCAIIAMGTHGAGAVGSLLTGSVTTKVIHIGVRPILVIPPTQLPSLSDSGPPRRAGRILVPVDGSPGAAEAVREVVRCASWFRDAPEVHLLAVYEGTPLDVEIAAMVDAQALRTHQHKALEAALAPARTALAGTGMAVVEHTAIGSPVEAIRAAVAVNRCDLVCMGTRGMGAVRNLILGSTTAKALRAVDVPLLVVPPSAP